MVHFESTQRPLPFMTSGHVSPHCPQLTGSLVTSRHESVHLVVPLGQFKPHTPLPQTWPLGQGLSQPPQ
jgi:hypothetical protein